MNKDPVYQIIQGDEQVKEILADPQVQKVLEHLRFTGQLDLHQIMSKDQTLGRKLQLLIHKGVLNANPY